MKSENVNYLLKESSDDQPIKLITSHLVKFFVTKYERPVLVITQSQISGSEAKQYYSDFSIKQRQLVSFLVCAKTEILLEKLLQIDVTTTTQNVPKAIIVESLHNWCDTSPLEKIPRTYTTIVAATQDAVNVLSQISGSSCYSFVATCLDEMPKSVVDLFYGGRVVNASLNNVDEILKDL